MPRLRNSLRRAYKLPAREEGLSAGGAGNGNLLVNRHIIDFNSETQASTCSSVPTVIRKPSPQPA